MCFRFVHIADVHLDTPFQNRDKTLRKKLSHSLMDAFSSAVEFAIEKDVHAFLIAGDLFDGGTLSYVTARFLDEMLNRLREHEIYVFYASGNHDPSMQILKSPAIKWPENVHIFSSAEPEIIPVLDTHGNILANIVGAGHERWAEERNLARRFPSATGDTPYIGILHCLMIEGESAGAHECYAPCSRLDLEEKGYTYWALGHIHKRTEYKENTCIVYPGNISGRSFKETGAKGMYYVEVAQGGAVGMEFVPLSKALWLDVDIKNLKNIKDWISLERTIKMHLEKKLKAQLDLLGGQEVIVARANLKGSSPMYVHLLNEDSIGELEHNIELDLGIDKLVIDNESVYSTIDIDDYIDGPHLASYVLKLIQRAREDKQLLLSLAPAPIAGSTIDKQGRDISLEYLEELLDGMEHEALLRLIKEEDT